MSIASSTDYFASAIAFWIFCTSSRAWGANSPFALEPQILFVFEQRALWLAHLQQHISCQQMCFGEIGF